MREIKVHHLKIKPKYMKDIAVGKKAFEVRKDDRDYQIGDILYLQEYENGKYTGFILKNEVTYVLGRDEEEKKYVREGYVILGIREVYRHRPVFYKS